MNIGFGSAFRPYDLTARVGEGFAGTPGNVKREFSAEQVAQRPEFSRDLPLDLQVLSSALASVEIVKGQLEKARALDNQPEDADPGAGKVSITERREKQHALGPMTYLTQREADLTPGAESLLFHYESHRDDGLQSLQSSYYKRLPDGSELVGRHFGGGSPSTTEVHIGPSGALTVLSDR